MANLAGEEPIKNIRAGDSEKLEKNGGANS
jgi:hypothetical protein